MTLSSMYISISVVYGYKANYWENSLDRIFGKTFEHATVNKEFLSSL